MLAGMRWASGSLRNVTILFLCLLLPAAGCYRTLSERGNEPEAQVTQPSEPAAIVKKRLLELFELCRADKYQQAASYIVYRGPDKEREWKDVTRTSNPVEQQAVLEACQRIKEYLLDSDGYDFGHFSVQEESEGVWHVWEVFFATRTGKKKRYFAFLKIMGQYALGDID